MIIIHADKVRWLLWLRWKLFLRGFTRDKTRIFSTIVLIIFGLPFYGGIAVGTFFAYRYLPYPANVEVLFLVLTGVYLFWMVLPLLEFTVNEGLDVSKLLPFPLTRAELMVGLLFSTLLDIPMFGLLLVFVAVIVGWAISFPVTLFAIVAMLIFYAQVVGMSQLVLALLMRTLQSRRFRDLSIIVVALFSSSCYIFQQIVLSGIGRGNIVTSLQQEKFSAYLQWLPPGMTARAIQQATLGNWGSSLLWLVLSLGASMLVLYLWAIVLERSLSTPEVGGAVRTRRQKAGASPIAQTQQSYPSLRQRIMTSQTVVIALKELKYFWRDPQLKALLVSSLSIVIVFIIGPLFNPTSSSGSGWTVLTFSAPLAVFFSVFTLSYNSLGMERQSLTTLFLFPVEPRRILSGKNLAVALMGVIELLVLVCISALLSHEWNFVVPVLTLGLAGIAVMLGCGNVSSVFLPQRMRQIQRGFQATGASSGNSGCMRGLLSMVMMLVSAVLLLPVAAALFVPLFFDMQWVWVFAIPAALIYAIVFHQLILWWVSPRMLAREPEILAITTRE